MSRWTTEHIPDQTGRVALVTGANSGLGYDTTLALAQKGAAVIMACRNTEKGEEARGRVLAQVPGAALTVMALDLASLESVRAFAAGFRPQHDRLDLLINNAGVMAIPRRDTVDGFEMQFATNHLGPFALTGLLLDLLLRTPGSRVVTVSSSVSFMGHIDFDDLHSTRSYTRYGAYGQSKLANILFAFELQRKLAACGADTLSLAAHPGYAATNLQRNSTRASGSLVERCFYGISNQFVAQSCLMGTLPQLYAATAPEAQGGTFIGPRWAHMRGYPRPVRGPKEAYDEAVAARLWQVSEELTGVVYAWPEPVA